MRSYLQVVFGGLVLLFGLSIIIGVLFDINVLGIYFSVGLILLGIWILVRPRILPEDSDIRLLLFGDFKRRGDWKVQGEEIWMFVGDVRLDLTGAQIPSGETTFRVLAFVGDIDLKIPEGIGVSVSSIGMVSDTKIMGKKRDYIFTPLEYKNDLYDTAESKINLETVCFVGDIDVIEIPNPEEPIDPAQEQ